MRGYIYLSFFCAVLTFVSPDAPRAAENTPENAAEYRAPVTSAKLGPVSPHQPAQSGAAGAAGPAAGVPGQTQNGSPQPQTAGQPTGQGQPGQAAPGQNASGQNGAGQYAPGQTGPGQPTPWPPSSPSGTMMPYSALGALLPVSDPASSPSAAPAANPADNPAVNPAANPAASAPVNPAAGFAPPPLPPAGYVPGYAPPPGYAPGSYPPAAAFDAQGQGGDVVYGTGQLQGNNFDDRGSVSQYRDPLTGDIVTSVVPPSQQDQPDYGTIFVAPQIYPNGRPWGPSPYGPMPRPGQPYVSPSVTWQPGMPADKHRHRHDDRRHEERGYDDGYGRHSGDRYDARPGPQGNAPYDQRDADRSRDGRERR